VLVAEQELDRAVLRRLESRRTAERGPKRLVLRRRQRLEHRPLLEELLLDQLDPREDLEARVEPVCPHEPGRCLELVEHQLQPQFGRLMLDDEQHFVVPRRRARGSRQRRLRTQQLIEPQIARIGQAVREIGDESGFEVARGHGCGVGSHCSNKLPVRRS